jgi:exosome complex protein LRP1
MSSSIAEDFPSSLKQPIRDLHESLADLKQCLHTFNTNYKTIQSLATDPLSKAKIELTTAYAMNSLFWIYLTTKGVNPQEQPIKDEISRLKSYAQRVQQIEDKRKAAKVDTNAAKRFIRSALWEPKDYLDRHSDTESNCNKRKPSDESWDESTTTTHSPHNSSADPARHKRHKK